MDWIDNKSHNPIEKFDVYYYDIDVIREKIPDDVLYFLIEL